MTRGSDFDIFLATAPGLETLLCAEVSKKGFRQPQLVPGGVIIRGGWPEVWRANLWVRGAGRVLARLSSFRADNLAQLGSRAHRVPWSKALRSDVSFRVKASCTGSRIYHSGAAAERVEIAIRETLGASHAPDAAVVVMVRIDQDICTVSVDTSGAPLHKRGYKEAVNTAPMRETIASLFLRQCGYNGTEAIIDPMCGSGTFVIEAAEIAARLNPGRLRHFAFERLASFDPAAWEQMRAVKSGRMPSVRCYGSDRDAGAVEMSRANASRAGVTAFTEFRQGTISELLPPVEPPGLVITNPPYGTRLSKGKDLSALYGALGEVLKRRFAGWRVGIIAREPRLAHATGMEFLPVHEPFLHGGLRVFLFQTSPLR